MASFEAIFVLSPISFRLVSFRSVPFRSARCLFRLVSLRRALRLFAPLPRILVPFCVAWFRFVPVSFLSPLQSRFRFGSFRSVGVESGATESHYTTVHDYDSSTELYISNTVVHSLLITEMQQRYFIYYVCTGHQPGKKVVNPARGQLNRENEHFPVLIRA